MRIESGALSAPSIVLGLFVYTLVVEPMGGFSGIAGAIALGFIVLPVVVRTTDEMLRLVPAQMREHRAWLAKQHCSAERDDDPYERELVVQPH